MNKTQLLWLYVFAALAVTSCSDSQPIELSGKAQGTYYTIAYYDHQGRDFQQAIDSFLTAFDNTASLWVDSSLIRRVNSNEDSVVSPLFADLLTKSLWSNTFTQGAFDCRVGRLVQAWGFSFKQHEELTQHDIDSLLQTARKGIHLDTAADNTISIVKEDENTELDFNAIAQGYSVDMIADFLEQQGIKDYLIDIGGEVIAHGKKANGDSWRVGIERPAVEKYDTPEVELAIALNDLSVVTSGSYRKYYERDGVKYSHTIDPATGRPVQHTLLSVSVVDSCAWRADAMATAFMVMGLEKSQAFIAQHPNDPRLQRVFFIYDDNGHYQTYATAAFEKLIIK